ARRTAGSSIHRKVAAIFSWFPLLLFVMQRTLSHARRRSKTGEGGACSWLDKTYPAAGNKDGQPQQRGRGCQQADARRDLATAHRAVKMRAMMPQHDVAEREDQRGGRGEQGRIMQVVERLDREQPESRYHCEYSTSGGSANEKRSQHREGGVVSLSEQMEQAQVERKYRAQQQGDAEDVRGIDE